MRRYARDNDSSAALIHGMQEFLTSYARALTRSKKLKVRFIDTGPAPAWLEDTTIWLVESYFDMKRDVNALVKAVVAVVHEDGHYMWSPTAKHPLRMWAGANGFFKSMNILEDGRNETFSTKIWPGTIPWFHIMVLDVVLGGTIDEYSWPFVAGREYLDPKIRNRAAQMFNGDANSVAQIAKEYNRIVPVKDQTRAKELIAEFHNILGSNPLDTGCQYDHNGASAGQDGPLKGEQIELGEFPMPEPRTTKTPPPPDEEEKEEEQQQPSVPQDDDDGDTGDTPDDDGADDGEGEGEGEGEEDTTEDVTPPSNDGEGEGEDSDDTDPGEPAESGGDDAGTGAGEDDGEEVDPRELVAQIREQMEQSDDIQRISDMTAEELEDKGLDKIKDPTPTDVYKTHEMRPEYANIKESLVSALGRLTSQARPGWKSRERAGAVDVRAYIRNKHSVRVFKKYKPSQLRKTGVFLVVLLDDSASMGYTGGNEAVDMAHAIKSAADRLRIKCSVYSFGTETRMLYGPESKAGDVPDDTYKGSGGTYVKDALHLAARDFSRSDDAYKMLVLLTDGDFSDFYNYYNYYVPSDELKNEMGRIKRTGAESHLFLYNYEEDQVEEQRKTRHCDTAVAVSDLSDVARHVEDVLVKHMQDVLHGAY